MLEVSVQLQSMNLETADQARNVDCVVDLHFNSHLKTNTKSAYYHTNNIASMKKFLSKKKKRRKERRGSWEEKKLGTTMFLDLNTSQTCLLGMKHHILKFSQQICLLSYLIK